MVTTIAFFGESKGQATTTRHPPLDLEPFVKMVTSKTYICPNFNMKFVYFPTYLYPEFNAALYL
uniref:Uncharacterized protein n=1 Tax=Megaselia scalaris TaxID=36166 RepID=T1GEC1_MEGSC